MARFYLYGANPSELAQQQAGYESRYTNAAEGNRGAAMAASQFNIQAQMQAQAADEQARARDAAVRMQAWQMQSQEAERAATIAENQRRHALNQSMVMEDRARSKDFQDRFAILEATQKLEQGKLTNELLKVRPQQEQNSRLAGVMDFFAVPRRKDTVNVDAFSKAYSVPKAEILPFVDRADNEFAAQQAAQLNAALNARLIAAMRTRAGEVPIPETPELRAKIRSAVEAEAGNVHPSVKFNPATGFWQVGEPKAAQSSAPTGSNSAVKKYVLVNGQLQLQ